MYTGIVQHLCKIKSIQFQDSILTYSVTLPDDLLQELSTGASVAIDGVCQTVVKIDGNSVTFDAIQETLNKTTLKDLKVGQKVNVERSLKFGDEVGGHLIAGHVLGTALISNIKSIGDSRIVTICCNSEWMKYILHKGFIGLDGVSLTVGDRDDHTFEINLIPETLKRTTFGFKSVGDRVNLELDHQTQTIVDTVTNLLS